MKMMIDYYQERKRAIFLIGKTPKNYTEEDPGEDGVETAPTKIKIKKKIIWS